MGKLNFLGIGPRIALVLLPWLTLTIIFSILYEGQFNYVSDNSKFLTVAGIVLLGLGLVFYATTIRLLLKGLKNTMLITHGSYSLCQNPLYASIILLIIPSVSLLLNSWLILISSIAAYGTGCISFPDFANIYLIMLVIKTDSMSFEYLK